MLFLPPNQQRQSTESKLYDFSGLSTYGLTAQEREMITLPTLLVWYGTPLCCSIIYQTIMQ